MSMFGAPFGIFIAMLVMDKIPRKTMGVGLLILIAVLGYIYSLQTSMLLITLIGFFLITFVYMYVCYARQSMCRRSGQQKRNFAVPAWRTLSAESAVSLPPMRWRYYSTVMA